MAEVFQYFNKFIRTNEMPDARHANARRMMRCQTPDTQMPDVVFWDAGLIFRCQIPDTQMPDVLFWDARWQLNKSTHQPINKSTNQPINKSTHQQINSSTLHETQSHQMETHDRRTAHHPWGSIT